jgi:ABC-type transporter Mla subunit MlaD
VTDQELAAEIRELAGHPALSSRADQLTELAAALSYPGRAALWCELDLFAAFPPADTVQVIVRSTRSWRKIAKFIYYIQAVLVFLPITITWLGLKQATAAYGEALASEGIEAARHPFLEMWQQGFDGKLAGLWKFDNVAVMTLSTIGLLIAVTLAERYMHRWEDERASEQEEELRPRLSAALTRATLHLGQVKLASPARFQAELTKSASELTKFGRTMSKVHTQVVAELERALEATGQATDALTAGVAEVRDSITTLDKHLAAISSTAETLLQSVERTAYAIDSVGEKTDLAVDRVGDRLGTVLLDSTTGVRKALDELANLTEQAVRDMSASTGEVVRDLATSTGQAVRELTDSTEQAARDTAAGLSARVGELASAMAGIGSAVGRVETAATESGDRISDALINGTGTLSAVLGGAGADIRVALDDWAGTASAHASRIEMVSDTAGRTVRLLEETREALDRLPANLARSLQEVPEAVREVTGPEISALQAAIARLDEAVRQVATAVTAGLTSGDGDPSGAGGAAVPARASVPAVPANHPHGPTSSDAGRASVTAENSGVWAEGRHP